MVTTAQGSRWRRARGDVLRQVVAGAVIALPITGATLYLGDRQADRQEVLENVRFVRDRASDGLGLKPFAGLDLQDSFLAGLDLGCTANAQSEPARCADFRDADLTSAYLAGTELSGADLRGARLAEANLAFAVLEGSNLTRADLQETNLREAVLKGTDLSGADLTGARLDEATVEDVCFDAATRWPRTFTPPQPSCIERRPPMGRGERGAEGSSSGRGSS